MAKQSTLTGAKKKSTQKTGQKRKTSFAVREAKSAVLDSRPMGALLSEHASGIIGGPPTTQWLRETNPKGGDKAPDDAAQETDSD